MKIKMEDIMKEKAHSLKREREKEMCVGIFGDEEKKRLIKTIK